jgi:type IV secretion system protein VirB6
MGFLVETETSVTAGLTAVANAFGAGLLDTFRPAFIVGFTIWITFIAYEVAFGKSEDGFTYLFTKIGKIFVIGVIALYGWPEMAELLDAVRQGFVGDNTIGSVLETQLMEPMVSLWGALLVWFTTTIEQYGITDLEKILQTLFVFGVMFLTYLAMALAVSVFAVVALAMYMVASAVFIILLAVGPFFLLCLAFPFTQRFFETFIGNVMTAILGMAFTALMVFFVADFFGLVNINTVVPTAVDSTTVYSMLNSMAVLFASKCGTSLLIIYLCWKVFDLAAALGGGLNMGNNMVGGVRNMLRDLQRSQGGGKGGPPSMVNQIAQGNAGGGTAMASQRAARANSTFTGMAMSAASPAIGAIGSTAMSGARNLASIASYSAGRAAGSVGRFAYNRHSQTQNRMSNAG